MDKLLKILCEIKPNVDFTKEKNLIDDKILDSFSIVKLVSRLSEEYDIEITPMQIVPENFQSAEAIYSMIESLED